MLDRPYQTPSAILCPPSIALDPDQTEASAGRILWQYLKARRLTACHIPNEHMAPQERMRLKSQGLVPGMPDYLIFHGFFYDGEPRMGLAIELKRAKGGVISAAQGAVICELRELYWVAEVCHGSDQAINLIEEIYGRDFVSIHRHATGVKTHQDI